METNRLDGKSQHFGQRDIRTGAWCWQNKKTLKTISDVFDATNDAASARSVYLALTQIASDEQSETFTRPIGHIARTAAVSYKTAAALLTRFESLKLLQIQRSLVPGTKEHAPSTYTLGNSCPTLGNDRNGASFPREEKNLRKISLKNKKKKRDTLQRPHAASASAPAAPPLSLPVGFELLSEEEKTIVSYYNETLPPLGWLPVTRITEELRKAIAVLETECLRLISEAASEPPSAWPDRRTLVRLCWHAY